jgi:RNA polymerase sigma factor (sigma-70 family)
MLASREDAEDVLQEVFAAAFNAVLADEREINVRPWLYRIARNRSLNHLRRASAVGVDSMDIHFADHGLSTGEQVIRREGFRQLLEDVKQLPETQRTALLLREIDALSYEQIAHAMETTIPSVKSLLVRARISLGEAAEARKLSCAEVRMELGEVAEGLTKLSAPARRHTRECDRCRSFKRVLKENNQALAMVLPVAPLVMLKKLFFAKLGTTASAGGAHVAGGAGAGATVGAGAGAAAGTAGGAGASGGILTFGAGALATKAAAGLAAAAIVTAGAVAVTPATHHHTTHIRASEAQVPREPTVVRVEDQPVSATQAVLITPASHSKSHRRHLNGAATPALSTAATQGKAGKAQPGATEVTEVASGTTELPDPVTPGAIAGPTPSPAPTSTLLPSTPSAPVSPPAATGNASSPAGQSPSLPTDPATPLSPDTPLPATTPASSTTPTTPSTAAVETGAPVAPSPNPTSTPTAASPTPSQASAPQITAAPDTPAPPTS